MAWFQKFTIRRKNKFKVVIFILVLLSILFIFSLEIVLFMHDKKEITWSPLTVLEINSGEKCIFVNPQETYRHVTLDRNKLVFPELIHRNAWDCKIDDDKILVAYINSKSPNELVFKIITQGNSQQRIVLESLNDTWIK